MTDFDIALKEVRFSQIFKNEDCKEIIKKEYEEIRMPDIELGCQKYLFENTTEAERQEYEIARQSNNSYRKDTNAYVETEAERVYTDKLINLRAEFHNHFEMTGSVIEGYFIPNIQFTSTATTLSEIYNLIKNYKELVKKEIDSTQKANEYFNEVKYELGKLDEILISYLLSKIRLTDNLTVNYHRIDNPDGDVSERWGQLKNSFNLLVDEYLNGYVNVQEQNDISNKSFGVSDENLKRLTEYFRPQFNGRANNRNILKEDLIPCLEKARNSGKEYTAIALVIYNSKYFKRDNLSFKRWAETLFDLIGIKETIYKPSQVRGKADSYKAGEFYFL